MMAQFAFLAEDGTVISILTGTETDWPDLRALDRVQPAPNPNVLPGWRWNGAMFMPPLTPVGPRTVTSLEFRRRFTEDERRAITKAARTNDALQVWMDDLASAGEVALDAAEVAAGLALLVGANLLTAGRAAELVT